MSVFLTVALIVLVFMIIYQIAQASEYAAALRRDEKKGMMATNRIMAWLLLAFFFVGLYGVWYCNSLLVDKMLPKSASKEGEAYDMMFTVTLTVTGIVFFITQALLFWFAFRYQASEKKTSYFLAHNNKLEIIWTTIPAIAMAVLVAIGLRNWMHITSEAPAESNVVEVVGKQFNWLIRYPGKDNALGKRFYTNINDANNVLGMDKNDPANADDIIAENGELHLVVNKPVKLIIGSRDVIHDVGLPHFRFKMDAVPGITTTIWFTPTITTAEMKKITGNPNFVYEISCDQMCGKGHYAMRGTVIVETQEEYEKWLASQKPYLAAQSGNETATPAGENAAPAADSVKAITMK